MLPSPRSRSGLALVLAALWAANGVVAWSQGSQRKNASPALARGKRTFASTCAGCHGLDGRGGERAPNIAENPKVQRLSSAQIAHIIQNGIPGTAMPAFHSLEISDVQVVVTYLRTLQGTKTAITLPGNPERGQTLFLAKAGCSNCHMVGGQGGFIASDLSSYAGTRTGEQIRSAITNPAPGSDLQARLVRATTRAGEKLVGRIRNEDNFSLQLQALDGTFHFVTKSDLESLEHDTQTLMPFDYSSTLSSDELNDIVSYLMRAASASQSRTPAKVDEWEE
jgi:cytochrome c oxidase cbb3-type subunit 3